MKICFPKLLLCILTSLLSVLPLMADNEVLEILPDKKVIHLKKLELADNTSLLDVLQMVPEIVGRGADEIINNFDIQLSDKSLGASSQIVLQQILLSELEKIEITTSPTVTQQKNGQGGVINLVPATLDKGFGGEAMMSVSSQLEFIPNVFLSYRDDKFQVRGNLQLEHSSPIRNTFTEKYISNGVLDSYDTTRVRFLQQTAKIDMEYRPTSKDVFKFWLLETVNRKENFNSHYMDDTWDLSEEYGEGHQLHDTDFSRDTSRTRALNLSAKLKYTHNFASDNELSAYVSYNYAGSDDFVNEVIPHNMDAEVAYKRDILNRNLNVLNLELGCDYTLKLEKNPVLYVNNQYCSPYVQFKYKRPHLNIDAGIRYQYFSRYFRTPDDIWSDNTNHDFASNINVVWRINEHHSLKLVLDRNVIRPSDQQLFPYILKPSSGIWTMGNPHLKNTSLNTVSLAYMFDWKRNGHSIILNADIGYLRADDVVETSYRFDSNTGHYYTVPTNAGANDIANLNASLIYRYRVFSMAFSGNYYYGFQGMKYSSDFISHYNLSLSTFFHFPGRWTLTGQLLYNSPIERSESLQGDCFYARVHLNKGIGAWEIFAELGDIFDYLSMDRTWRTMEHSYSLYDLYVRTVTVGAIFKFGNKRR